MHAGFPCLSREINGLLCLGARKGKVDGLLDRVGGKLVASGMAKVVEFGLPFVMRLSPFHRDWATSAEEFFRENFEESGASERIISFLNLADDPAVERIITPIRGFSSSICRVASMPFKAGMAISMTTASGCSSWICLTA